MREGGALCSAPFPVVVAVRSPAAYFPRRTRRFVGLLGGLVLLVGELPAVAQQDGIRVLPPEELSRTSETRPARPRGSYTKIVEVDCSAPGQSIRRALGAQARHLTVRISGICEENVEIARDRVTLIGSDPAVDGIRSPGSGDPHEASLKIRNARAVRIENLKLIDSSWYGLRVLGAHEEIQIVNCRLENNGQWGARISDSVVLLEEVSASGNGNLPSVFAKGGVLVELGSRIECVDCTIRHNPAAATNIGAFVFQGALAGFQGGKVEGATALLALGGSSIGAEDTVLGGQFMVQSLRLSEVEILGGAHAGSIFALSKSVVSLFGALQTTNPIGNTLDRSSTLVVDDRFGVPSALVGVTVLKNFSEGTIVDSATVGDLACTAGGRAFCDGTETKTSSNCSLCP